MYDFVPNIVEDTDTLLFALFWSPNIFGSLADDCPTVFTG